MDTHSHADNLAQKGNLQKGKMDVDGFVLTSYSRIGDLNQPLNIYIEGDGLAWLSRKELSLDPTPREAIGLALASQEPAINVVYLARPCQFNDFNQKPCDSAYWSNKRFSEKVILAMNQELDSFVQKTNNQKVNLIGYSGGAAVAVLLAARRHDVDSLKTIAGNLDTEFVNQYHKVDAMHESLNPIDVANQVRDIPQLHFVGTNDKVIPKAVAQHFIDQQQSANCANIIEIQAEHQKKWEDKWRSLLQMSFYCKN
jgi:predicted esterase